MLECLLRTQSITNLIILNYLEFVRKTSFVLKYENTIYIFFFNSKFNFN